MAVSLNAVTPIKSIEKKVINIEDREIKVVQYLSTEKKINFIEDVLDRVFNENNISSPVRVEIYFYLNLIKYYTDITITEKMMENAAKTYDSLEMNNIIERVIDAIPEDEYNTIFDYVNETIEHYEQYAHSFAGNIKNVMQDYQNTEMDIEKLMTDLSEVENNKVLNQILEELS